MSVAQKIDHVVEEIVDMGEKAEQLLVKTRKLIITLEHEAKRLQHHMSRIKTMLGFETKVCTICAKGIPDHVVDHCHHVFCEQCASRMMNIAPRKCFVCRSPVIAMYKIFS